MWTRAQSVDTPIGGIGSIRSEGKMVAIGIRLDLEGTIPYR
jgi:hypothetical protein